MSTRLRIAIATSALVVAALGAAVLALYPHRAETTFSTPHPLTSVRHSSMLGARCFLEDPLRAGGERTPYPCGRAPQPADEGDDDVLAMLGTKATGVVTFCVFDRRRARDLACFDGWYPAYMRVTPERVVVVDREASTLDVMFVDRATLARTTERADWMSGPDHVVRERDARGRVWHIGETHLELGGAP